MAPDISIKRGPETEGSGVQLEVDHQNTAKRVKSTNNNKAQPASSGFEEDLTRLTEEINAAGGKL